MQKAVLLLVMCVSLCMMVGCANTANKVQPKDTFVTIADDAGREVALSAKPLRIVVLSDIFLEPVHALGGNIVGRPDSREVLPDFASDIASVGMASYQIDMEKVIELHPDLVLVNKGMNDKYVPILEENGIKAVVIDFKSYADVRHGIEILGQLLDNAEKGQAIIAAMDQDINDIKAKISQQEKSAAILHSTAQGLTVQLPGSIAGSVADMLGIANVAADMSPLMKNPDAAPYSMETLVEKNPDMIFITTMGNIEQMKKSMDEMFLSNPAWQTVAAVREKKVYYLSQQNFLFSPGIHYPEAVHEMAALAYPEKMAAQNSKGL